MREKAQLAGQTIIISKGALRGKEYQVEDWWENVYGASWMFAKGNPACLKYAIRTGCQDFSVPNDNDVLYGKIGGSGELVHITEL